MDFGYSLTGALVGFLVGLTGVGGGSLMAPLLILMFGFSPAVAIGTDLWFAAITKTVGGAIHRRIGSLDWSIILKLAAGSVPAAIVTLVWLWRYHDGHLDSGILLRILGAALLVTAILVPLKHRLQAPLQHWKHRMMGPGLRKGQLAATVAGGAAVGVLVTITSVGAGALVAVMLMILYPLRLDTRSIVGTDIVHAIPLALVAAIGHSWLGNVDWQLLLTLLLGSIPGIIAGSFAAGRVNEALVRVALAIMLAITGTKLLLS